VKKLLKELIALVCALCVAAALIFLYTLNLGQTNYDTFVGKVNKLPIVISSPVYGEILTMPVTEGAIVTKGKLLATIQILAPHFTLPASNDLFQVYQNILSVQSPADGIVGKVTLAPLSTIESAGSLMQIYTAGNTEIQILLPQGKDMSDYEAFYAATTQNGPKYPLQVLGQVPTDVVSDIPQTTTVYRAKCQQVTACQNIINNEAITIYAQKKQAKSPFFNIPVISPGSLWNMLTKNI
jgi:hypothetical protein